jgi:hypothetical protein
MDVLSRGLEASPRARGPYDDIAVFFMYKMLNFGNEKTFIWFRNYIYQNPVSGYN